MYAHDLFFYRALLSNRRFRVSGNGFMSHWFSTPDGVPQGSVSAPQLFIIYIHDLIDAIQSQYIHINLFADDIVIWPAWILLCEFPSNVMIKMQETLDKLSTWASTWKLTFSSNKDTDDHLLSSILHSLRFGQRFPSHTIRIQHHYC